MVLVSSQSQKNTLVNEELDDVYATCADTIEAAMRLEPQTFLGSTASGTLMWSLLSVWGSMIYFVARTILEMSGMT